MGKQRRQADPVFSTHRAFYKEIPRTADVMLVENVPEYGTEARNLSDYEKLKGWVQYPDLTQYCANERGRGELQDGSLQTLTTNSSLIYSKAHKRFLSAQEMVATHILPTCSEHARKCKAPIVELEHMPESHACRMAGNTMSVPCVAALLLTAIINLKLV
ncbi:unnamed protein product [Durusdinium trenchii]|uniref:Uncharacterized protein n=1 Tax=Durusdinium trenchii TaxID=1381693 RepID=A0ABP0ILK2_9DINO